MTPEELEAAKHLLAHYGYNYPRGGSFTTKFIECLEKADYRNRARLLGAFHEYRAAVGLLDRQGADALDSMVTMILDAQQQKRAES